MAFAEIKTVSSCYALYFNFPLTLYNYNNMKKGLRNMDCVFCKITNGSIPSKKVYEDDKILAFYDLEPQAPVHVLIIPKEHIACANEITSENSAVVAYIFEKIPQIAKSLGLSSGYRIVNNCGSDGGQTVFHMHFHLLGGKKLNVNMA